jgi:uncharacterized protein YraI
MNKRSILALGAAAVMAAAPALAQVSATAATDLNLRAGPGPDQEILGVIPANGEVSVDGCLEAANWCQVSFEGTQGWAYGDYLSATAEGQAEPVIVFENREALQVPVITVDNVATTSADTGDAVDEAADAAVGAGAGAAFAAALIGGPAAIAAGAALGAATAGAIGEDSPEYQYVLNNPTDNIYMDGEVVQGAGIPEEVELVVIPDTQYSYLTVNNLPVIIDNETRQIVRIVR